MYWEMCVVYGVRKLNKIIIYSAGTTFKKIY